MRKISSFVSLCAFIAMMCFTSTARADEGMWTLYNLPAATEQTLR